MDQGVVDSGTIRDRPGPTTGPADISEFLDRGVSGLKPDELEQFISGFAGPTTPEVSDGPVALTFKHAMEDLKALYGEAALAKPTTKKPNGSELASWFWNDTHAGALLRELQSKLLNHEDDQLRMVATIIMVPEEQL